MKRLMKGFLVILFVMVATNAKAQLISYSQWERSPQLFREAYIVGAFDSLIAFANFGVGDHYFECIKQSKMTGVQMAENVRNFASSRPEYHAGGMEVILINYLIGVCGKPPVQ